MAAVSVAFNGAIVTGAESGSDGGTWNEYGKTKTPSQEQDVLYQGNYCQSVKVSSTSYGLDFVDGAALDFTSPRYMIAKINVTTTGLIDQTVADGMQYELGSGRSDRYDYYLSGLYEGPYPAARGGWLIVAIDPNEIAFRDAITGTPALASLDHYAIWARITGSSKVENVIHDRIDEFVVGSGMTLTGGDGGSTKGVFEDFYDQDEGNTSNRYGLVTKGSGEIVVRGFLVIGSATATGFDDANFFLVFPKDRVGEGTYGLKVDVQSSSTDVDFEAGTFKGLGNYSRKLFFDTALEVDGGNDEVDITAHGYESGDYVYYSDEGGADTIGLTDATYYFVRAVTADSLAFYAVGATVGRQNSLSDTTRVTLTTQTAPGENHSLLRDPDNRPDITVSGTAGAVDFASCSFDGVRILTLTSKATIDGGFILNTGNIVASTASLDGVSINCDTLEEGDALFDPLTTMTNIKNCTITAGDEGHFARLTSSGGTSTNNTFTDFWAPAANGWKFHTITGIDDTSNEEITFDGNHGFTTGDAVYYNNEGGSDTIGLTNGNKYYVNVVDTDTVSVHLTKAAAVAGSSKINLTDGSSGETHSLYSSKAAIFNDSGGALTITVDGGSNPSYRNGTSASTTLSVSVNVNVHVEDIDGNAIQGAIVYIQRSPATSYTSDTGNTAGDDDFVVNEAVDTDQAQDGWIRVWDKSSNRLASFRYTSWTSKTFTLLTDVTGTVTTAGGVGQEGTQLTDSAADFGGTEDVVIGDAVRNVDDGSWAVVDEIVSTTELKTTPLAGGTDDEWDLNDNYRIHELPVTFTDNDDKVDIPLYMAQTDASGDITTYSHDYSAGDMDIIVRVRCNEGGTKYIPYNTSGKIESTGYSLNVVMQEDEVAT
jgi:hypothetical protein